MKYFTSTTVAALAALQASTGSAQATNYKANAETALNVLQQWYNSGSGLWDTTGWWNSGNCLTVLADLSAIDSNVLTNTGKSVFANTYTKAQGNTNTVSKSVDPKTFAMTSTMTSSSAKLRGRGFKGFINDYYDDEGWWALAWIRAYDVTGNSQYLTTAENIFSDMTGGWNASRCGGGIYWDKAHTYVNAIANELFLSVAAHLANRDSSQKSTYLNWAKQEWTWFQGSGMINSGNTINDGLKFTDAAKTQCASNGGTVWSYNQGVILGGLVELAKATGDNSYISTAQKIASAAISALSKNNILHDSCENNCGGDGNQFKGVFMRNLQALQAASTAVDYSGFIKANAQSIWNSDRNTTNNQLGVNWAQLVGTCTAATQSSALDAIVAAAAL